MYLVDIHNCIHINGLTNGGQKQRPLNIPPHHAPEITLVLIQVRDSVAVDQ